MMFYRCSRVVIATTLVTLISFQSRAEGTTAKSTSATAGHYVDRLDIRSEITARAATSNLIGIARVGGILVAVGDEGRILLSSDRGKTWSQSRVPLSSPLVAVAFPTPQQGWVVGHDGVILHTSDGGQNWERQLDGRTVGDLMVAYYEKAAAGGDPAMAKVLDDARQFQKEGPSKPFMDVYFENEKSGWVIGSFNMILKTADGGKTWEPWLDRTENEKGYSLHAMAVVDGELFIVGELGLIQRLDRAKNRFVAVKSPYEGSFFGVTGKPGAIYIYGLRGNLFRSTDRGHSWLSLKQPIGSAFIGGTVLNDGRLVLVSNAGELLVSDDDGETFTRYPTAERMGLYSAVTALDERAVVVVGDRGVRVESIERRIKSDQK